MRTIECWPMVGISCSLMTDWISGYFRIDNWKDRVGLCVKSECRFDLQYL